MVWIPHIGSVPTGLRQHHTQGVVAYCVFACGLWGPAWQNSQVLVQCDNQGAVAVVNSGYSKVQVIMHLLRCLFFIHARFNFYLRAAYIPGKCNVLADARRSLRPGPSSSSQPHHSATSALNSAGPQPTWLDITTLDPIVRQLFSIGLANSTKQTYASGANRYNRFCMQFGLTPYPMSEEALSYFVAFLFKEGLTPSSVKSYLLAIHDAQIAMGMGDPRMGEMPQLEHFIKGLSRLSPGQSRSHLSITPDILHHLRASWERLEAHFNGAMLWAAGCMCFFGFLRCGEVVVPSDLSFDATSHLAAGDVRVDDTSNPQYLQGHIKESKTDPFCQGVFVYLGRTYVDVCPVAAVLVYMVLCNSAQTRSFSSWMGGIWLVRSLIQQCERHTSRHQ